MNINNEGFGRVTAIQMKKHRKWKKMMNKFWESEHKMVGNRQQQGL